MIRRYFDPGTEEWLPLAMRKLADVTRMRRRLGLQKLVKPVVPKAGVLIWVCSAEYGDWIRITGRAGGYRAQSHAFGDVAIRVDVDGALVTQQPYQYADWSRDYATFAYVSGSDVVLDRGGVTVTLADSSAPSRRPDTTYWIAHSAALSHSGSVAVVVPKSGVATPTVSKLATVAKWTSGSPGSWSTVDVPVPPAVLSASGWSGSAASTSAVQGLAEFVSSSSTGPIYIGSAPPVWSSGLSPMNGQVRLHVNPYDLSKLYVTAQYWTIAAEVVAIDPYTPVPPSYPGGVVKVTQTPVQQVWSYDIAAGTWALEYTHDADEHPFVTYYYVRGHDGISWGSVDSYTSHANLTAMTVGFSPQEGMHVVHFDNRALPETTTTYGITGASSVHFYDAVCYDLITRSATADVYMDDEVLLPGYAVSSSSVDGFVLPESSFVVLQLAKDPAYPRGGLVQVAGYGGGGSSAVEWRWGAAETDKTTLPAQASSATVLFNKDMTRATGVDTGTGAIRQKVYENGAEIYDGIDDMPTADPNTVVTLFDIQWLSWDSLDRMYTFVGRDVTTPGTPGGGTIEVTMYTGTASSATLGFSFTVNSDPGNDDGFNADGTILYSTVSTSGTGSPVTTSDLNTATGVSDWTFTLDGGSYLAEVTDPGTPDVTDSLEYHEVSKLTSAPEYAVQATLTPTFHIDALGADVAFNGGHTHDLVLDESVI